MEKRPAGRSNRKRLVFSSVESQPSTTWNTSQHVQRAMKRMENSRPESSYAMKQLEEKFTKSN